MERLEATRATEATFALRVVALDGTVETDVSIRYVPRAADGWLERYLDDTARDMLDRTGSVDAPSWTCSATNWVRARTIRTTVLLPSLVEVWVVEHTELDVPFLVRMRVVS